MHNIFLGWSGDRSRKVAEAFNDWLPKVIPGAKPWMSDRHIIDATWFPKIIKKIQEVKSGIICITSENYDRPWILFEAGAIVISCEEGGFFPFLLDMKPGELDGLNYPIFSHELCSFEEEHVFRILKGLNRILGHTKDENKLKERFDSTWTCLKSKLDPISKNVPFPTYLLRRKRYRIQIASHCDLMFLTFVTEHIKESPFVFNNLIEEATDEIFICGQNLFFLTATEQKKENIVNKGIIFKALKDKKVRIMLCNPRSKWAVKTWGREIMRNKKLYREHLKFSVSIFEKWVREANNSNFEVKTTGFVPLSMTFVDPKKDSGKLVFTTATYDRKEPGPRPCYLILKKNHPNIFKYYIEAYNWAFKEFSNWVI